MIYGIYSILTIKQRINMYKVHTRQALRYINRIFYKMKRKTLRHPNGRKQMHSKEIAKYERLNNS